MTAETHIACERCHQCRLNRRHTCENLKLFSRLGLGCFSDYTLVPAAALRIVPRDIPIELATLMEPLGVSVRAITEAGVAGGSVCSFSAPAQSDCSPFWRHALTALPAVRSTRPSGGGAERAGDM